MKNKVKSCFYEVYRARRDNTGYLQCVEGAYFDDKKNALLAARKWAVNDPFFAYFVFEFPVYENEFKVYDPNFGDYESTNVGNRDLIATFF